MPAKKRDSGSELPENSLRSGMSKTETNPGSEALDLKEQSLGTDAISTPPISKEPSPTAGRTPRAKRAYVRRNYPEEPDSAFLDQVENLCSRWGRSLEHLSTLISNKLAAYEKIRQKEAELEEFKQKILAGEIEP